MNDIARRTNFAATLRRFAAEIRGNVTAREAIASGFELIAEASELCEDCGAPVVLDELPAPVLVPDLLPGVDLTGGA
jgi:hypothetical protein